ncbi:MAG: DUF3180 domain-containing protein [Actinomycetia bacterium]|nr:DUF3180 domain-containing protein [Actinomycetes bacterium]
MTPNPPRLRRVSARSLAIIAAVGLIIGRAARPVLERMDQVAPTVPWTASVALVFLAAVLGWLAYSTYQAVHKRQERFPSDRAVRQLVLAQASAIVGALVAGGYAGFALSFANSMDTDLGQERVIHSGVTALAGIAVIVAALLLERACEVPRDDDEATPSHGA